MSTVYIGFSVPSSLPPHVEWPQKEEKIVPLSYIWSPNHRTNELSVMLVCFFFVFSPAVLMR